MKDELIRKLNEAYNKLEKFNKENYRFAYN